MSSCAKPTGFRAHVFLILLLTFALSACGRQPPVPLAPVRPKAASGPLRVNPANPRYFTDGSGRSVYLTGAHTWGNFQDNGYTDPPPVFDYKAYLDLLESNNLNYIRLWSAWEEAKWAPWTTRDYWVSPTPYSRSGPGLALDDKPRFDLTQFNQDFFDRLRQRILAAGQRGIYVSVMLFNGWAVEAKVPKGGNPWRGHPYNADNNINNVNGDSDGDGQGSETHTLTIPTVTALQEAYVRKVVNSINDLDNVLFEISNESRPDSRDWQYHMIRYIKNYEVSKPKQHPVGMSALYPDGSNADLYGSPTDWISPKGELRNPPAAEGKKVILDDTDHLCGTCYDPSWVWKSFLRGRNPLLMDAYDGAATGFGPAGKMRARDPEWAATRRNMGYTLTYANRVNLTAMIPHGELASSGYCLASLTEQKPEYLVFVPGGGTVTVDVPSGNRLAVEWFNPARGEVILGRTISSGSGKNLTVPFRGDAVLYLREVTAEPKGTTN